MFEQFTGLLDQLTFQGGQGGTARIRSVQTGRLLIGDGTDTVRTITIAPVDLARACVITSQMIPGSAARHVLFKAALLNEVTLELKRYQINAGSDSGYYINWQVIEFDGDVNVQQITTSGNGEYAISPVDLTRTFLVWSCLSSLSATYSPGHAFPRVSLSAADKVKVETAGATTTIYVVEVK